MRKNIILKRNMLHSDSSNTIIMSKNLYHNAFTLAEVLITLAVIGIVAAMTIPNLVSSYREKAVVTKLTKIYATLSNAYQLAKIDYGSIDTWGLSAEKGHAPGNSENKVIDIMSKYLKTVSKCYYSDTTCKTWTVYNLEGEVDTVDIYGNRLALADGTVISHIYINSENCNFGGLLFCGSFKVDLNGDKLPNTYGKDIFQFTFTPEAIVASGINDKTQTDNPFSSSPTVNCFSSGRLHGIACTAWVIYNKNMDYLHCDDLSWDGKHKCSD